MEFLASYRKSYSTLPGTARWKFGLIIAAQCLVGVMDLLGIYLLSAALWLLNNQQAQNESSLSGYYTFFLKIEKFYRFEFF